jgi:choline dehydrogenase
MRRANLTVQTGARATRVRFDGRRAVGVDYLVDGQARSADAAREVVLAGGAVASPQLLLLSGVGPAEHLHQTGVEVVHDLPGVGGNLHDHLAAGVLADIRKPVTLASATARRHLVPYLLRRKGLLTSNVAEAAAFVRTRPGLPAPDLELLFAPVLFVDQGLSPPPGHGITLACILLQPRSRGRVTLASADPLAEPLIDPGYLTDPDGDDLRTLLDGVKLARKLLRTPAFDPWRCDEREPGPDTHTDADLHAHIRRLAQTLYHPVGTCRMGADPLAVVDAELRVHGLDGLRVADASVMPVITRGHTNAPAIMIGEKAARLIRRGAAVSA